MAFAGTGAVIAYADGCAEEGGSSAGPSAYPPVFADGAQSPGTGWEWRGTGPVGSSEGAWYRPYSGESWHPDLSHPEPIGPHWDWTAFTGASHRWMPDGSLVPQ